MEKQETGVDSFGRKFTDIVTMWEGEVATETKRAKWYRGGNDYWSVHAT